MCASINTASNNSSQEFLDIKKLINFRALFIEYRPDLYRENGNSFNPFEEDTNPSFKLYDDHGCDIGNDNKTYDIFDLHTT